MDSDGGTHHHSRRFRRRPVTEEGPVTTTTQRKVLLFAPAGGLVRCLRRAHRHRLENKYSFRPSQEIRTLRTYWRQRQDLVRSTGRHIQRMQKALTQMNIQLANVISDISGVTGQAILKAILD